MPTKSTKSTKAKSNVAKTTGKAGLLNKKVKFNWKIAVLIGFILTAAVGYLLVRLSQAGSWTRYVTYQISDNSMRGSYQGGGTWSTQTDTVQGVSMPVLEINGPAFAEGNSSYPAGHDTSATYVVCAQVKAVTSSGIILYGPGPNGTTTGTRVIIQPGDYTEICDQPGTWTGGQVPTLLNNVGTGSVIRVAKIYVNKLSSATNPATKPTASPVASPSTSATTNPAAKPTTSVSPTVSASPNPATK